MVTDAYIGRQFEGRYEILNLVGRGGMGSVYRAMDRNLQREVAVKVLREDFSSRPDLRQRFLQEAELAAQLDHPGIVPVYHVNGEGNLLYIVMELVPGGNLADLMNGLRRKRQWISMQEALQVVRQIALALQYAHEHGILHRDIKPANIMLRNRASGGLDYQPVVTDLGLAKVIDQNSSIQQPMMGTPNYMSPEQVLAQELDGRTDIYSLGLLLYELLVGQLPFHISGFPEAIKYHVNEPIKPPRSLYPDLPQSVEDLVLHAVAKNVNERILTAAAFAADIDGLSHIKGVQARPKSYGTVGLVTEWQLSVIDQTDRLQTPSGIQHSQIKEPSLQIRTPDGRFLTLALKRKFTIGREDGNDLVLDDTQTSRRHAEIRQQGKEYTITDLKSTNGTFLNRKRLEPNRSYPIGQSDDLRIGNHRIRLLLGENGPFEPGRAFHAALMYPSVGGAAGQQVDIPLRVTNQQDAPVRMDVSVIGLDNSWVRPLRPVDIPGKQEKTITVTLVLPDDLSNHRSQYRLILRTVDSISGEEQSLETQLQIIPSATVGDGGSDLAGQTENRVAEKQRTSKLIPALIGLLLVVIVAGIGVVLFGQRPPTAPAPSASSVTSVIPDDGSPTVQPTSDLTATAAAVALAMAMATSTSTPTQTATPSVTATPTKTETPSPTATATHMDTPTPLPPTATIKPTDTPTQGAVGPTSTPTPLKIGGTTPAPTLSPVKPTSTRVRPTFTPTRPPIPTQPPSTPAPAGQIEGFESVQGWSSSNGSWGILADSTEQVHDGSRAAKLAYTIAGTENSFLILQRSIPVASSPAQFTLWVYGDGSNHYLNIWAADSAGTEFQFSFGRINFQGWRQMTARTDPGLAWPNQNLSDKENTNPPQFPLRMTAIVLDVNPDGQNVSGTIYLDDLRGN